MTKEHIDYRVHISLLWSMESMLSKGDSEPSLTLQQPAPLSQHPKTELRTSVLRHFPSPFPKLPLSDRVPKASSVGVPLAHTPGSTVRFTSSAPSVMPEVMPLSRHYPWSLAPTIGQQCHGTDPGLAGQCVPSRERHTHSGGCNRTDRR